MLSVNKWTSDSPTAKQQHKYFLVNRRVSSNDNRDNRNNSANGCNSLCLEVTYYWDNKITIVNSLTIGKLSTSELQGVSPCSEKTSL